MSRSGRSVPVTLLPRRVVFGAVVILASLVLQAGTSFGGAAGGAGVGGGAGGAGVQAGAPQGQGPQTVTAGQPQGFSAMADVVWLASGLLELSKQPTKKLGLTRDQARKAKAILQQLVDQGLVSLEFKEEEMEALVPGRASNQGARPSEAEREKARKEREEREGKLTAAVAAIEATLTPAQIGFVDNLDVDLATYGFGDAARPGWQARQGAGGSPQQGGGQGAPVALDPAKLKALREQMVKMMKERAKLFQTLMTVLTKLAK